MRELQWNLGIISDEISQHFEHAVKVIVELGAGYVELRNLWGKNVTELSEQELSQAITLVKSARLKISNLDSPAFKCRLSDDNSYKKHLQILRKVVEISKRLDLSYTRIFTFWYEGQLEDVMDKLEERFGPAVDLAASEGITLVIENEYSCTVGTGAETRKFLDRLKTRWVRVLWDPGNAFFARETPFPRGYEQVKDNILHVHLKDASVINGNFVWLPIGEGSINYFDFFRAMKGKSQVLSLETHYRVPSGDPEESTRRSFQSMMSILREI
jgi:Sugar phosphate isomerases/epimerases